MAITPTVQRRLRGLRNVRFIRRMGLALDTPQLLIKEIQTKPGARASRQKNYRIRALPWSSA
jgi:hypothetical protein